MPEAIWAVSMYRQQDKGQLIELIQQFSNTVFIDVSLILDEIKRIVACIGTDLSVFWHCW